MDVLGIEVQELFVCTIGMFFHTIALLNSSRTCLGHGASVNWFKLFWKHQKPTWSVSLVGLFCIPAIFLSCHSYYKSIITCKLYQNKLFSLMLPVGLPKFMRCIAICEARKDFIWHNHLNMWHAFLIQVRPCKVYQSGWLLTFQIMVTFLQK